MSVKSMIHKMLSEVMHLNRLYSLSSIVEAYFESKQLSVTELGRAVSVSVQERSGIRKVDRMVGNEKLHGQRQVIYRQVARQLIGDKLRPWIIVDWSPLPNSSNQLLRAALVCEGRALSVYEEVHPESKLANRKVHREFLAQLKTILPELCCPILITDAGFHTSWFKQVRKHNWDYVGRVRGLVKYRLEHSAVWTSLNSLHRKASRTARLLGKVTLSKSTPYEGMLCYYRNAAKGRVSKNKLGQKRSCSHSKKYSKANKEPWVLATSLDGYNIATKVVKIYKTRMQIEEGFRDLKSSKYGFGFEQSYTRSRKRLENLLLIAMLASLVAWITGWLAEKEKRHYEFQANSIKHRRVLSLFYLGCRVIKKKMKIPIKPLSQITQQLVWAEDHV